MVLPPKGRRSGGVSPPAAARTRVAVVAFAPDRAWAVTGGQDNTIRLWEVSSGKERFRWEGHTQTPTAVTFSGDGSRVFSSSSDGTIRVYDTGEGNLIATLPRRDGFGRSVRWRSVPTARRSARRRRTPSVTVRDVAGGKPRQSYRLPGRVDNDVILSPDRRLAVSGDGPEHGVRVWDVESGTERGRLEGCSQRPQRLAFSPDGQYLFGSSADLKVRVWDLSKFGRGKEGVGPKP